MNNNPIPTNNVEISQTNFLNLLSLVSDGDLIHNVVNNDNTELLNFLLSEKKSQSKFKKKEFLSSLMTSAIVKTEQSKILNYLFEYNRKELSFINSIDEYDLKSIMRSFNTPKAYKSYFNAEELQEFKFTLLDKMQKSRYLWNDGAVLDNAVEVIFPVDYKDPKVLNSLIDYLSNSSHIAINNNLSAKIITTLKKEKIDDLPLNDEILNKLKLMAVRNAKRIVEENSYRGHPAARLNHYLAHFNLCTHFNINLDACNTPSFEGIKQTKDKSTLEGSTVLSELRKYVEKNKKSSAVVGEFIVKHDKKSLLKNIDLIDGKKLSKKQIGNKYKI